MQGFDIVASGQLAALPAFREKFGVLQPDGTYLIPARYLSAWNPIAPATEIVATFIFAPLLEDPAANGASSQPRSSPLLESYCSSLRLTGVCTWLAAESTALRLG